MTINIAIYSRKSCVTDTGESIQNQINICKEYIFNHIDKPQNCNLTIYTDEGFSAKNIDRPEFKKMIKDAENKNFSYIICYKLDRISRNISDFSKLIEKFNKMNISFVCVKEQFDTSVPMGRAMMYIASIFAQLERETIAERVRDNMIMLSKRGQWLGGTTPLGLKSCKMYIKDFKLNSKYKFFLNTDTKEIKIVKKIYSKFLECHSLTKTKQHLDNLNIKSRLGKKFSIPSIKKILTNPVYCSADDYARNYFEKIGANVCFKKAECDSSVGIISYNKRNYRENNGKINSITNWIIALGSHKSIINSEKWVKINKIINFSKKYRHKKINPLLHNKIICKICNSKMMQKCRADKINYDYICASKIYKLNKKCKCNNLNGIYTDKLIFYQTIMAGLKNNPFFIKKIYALKNRLLKNLNSDISQKSTFEASIIIKNINKKSQILFITNTIDYIFWDNAKLNIKLKNCNQ